MQEIGEDNGKCADVEGGFEASVLAENHRRRDDAVNRFEVCGEIEVVCGDGMQKTIC